MEIEKLKYPIGKFTPPENYSSEFLKECTNSVAGFPQRLISEVEHLNEEQLNTAYREEGWTVRQVVHHCADSHMNSLIRFKLTLTENKPTIKPYIEQYWAELEDSKLPIASSLQILLGVHHKLFVLIESLAHEDLNKEYIHPQYGKNFTLKEAIALYAWHGNHHLAHITELKKRKGW